MKATFLILWMTAALFVGCEHQHTDKHTISHNGHIDLVRLNNGEKWQVNLEMMPFIKGFKSLVAELTKYSGNDFKKIASSFQENHSKLISSCTMKGEAHNELYTWLLPHLDLAKELLHAHSNEEAKEITDKLKLSFETFNTYFQ